MARILLVEDDLTTLNILGTLLRAEGHDVVAAPEGLASPRAVARLAAVRERWAWVARRAT